MPYFIAILACVVVGVGFTLFQTQSKHVVATTEPVAIAEVREEPHMPTSIPTPATTGTETELPTEIEETPPVVPITDTIKETPPPVPTQVPTTPTPAPTSLYTDGTYHAQTSYRTPDRDTYQMDVSLTLSDDVITAATVTFDAQAARDGYVKRFLGAYTSKVVGQNLEDISLSRVGGASLTTNAFNTALATISNQAS